MSKRIKKEAEACGGALRILLSRSAYTVVVNTAADTATASLDDSVQLIMRIKPPVPAEIATTTQLSVVYTADDECTTVFCHMIAPDSAVKRVTYRGDGELEYGCYETHQVRYNRTGEITHVYVCVVNTQTSAAVTASLKLQTQLDMKLYWLPRESRMMPLRWFPPDLDPAEHGLRLDTRSVPQRTPLWFKLRGDVSGSKTVRYTGFFVTPSGATEFDSVAKARMRLGTLSEDKAMLCYLHVYPGRVFLEVGWCPVAGGPTGWGASPDGIIEDLQMTWARVPDHVRAQYSETERAAIDITHGACEFKTSRLKEGMESYFYPQLYMEMMALNTVWCDVLRYRPERQWSDASGRYTYLDRGAVFRVYRDRTLEQQLVRLWKRAHNNAHSLWTTVSEPEYVEMRAVFKKMASDAVPEPVLIDAAQDAVLADQLARYDTYQYNTQRRMRETHDESAVFVDPFEHVTQRAVELQQRQQDMSVADVKHYIVSQIEAYAGILKEFL